MKEDELKELREKAQEILAEMQIKLTEMVAISDNSKQKETELNTYHSRIIELKAAVEANAATLTDTLNNAVSLKQQIDEFHKHATEAKNKIDTLHQSSSTKTNEINVFYTTFQDLRQEVEDPDTGVGSTLSRANELFRLITKTNEDATKSKEEILSHKIKSEGLLSESSEMKGSIETTLSESEKLKIEIGKILDLVRDTGLANSFDRRRKRSEASCIISLCIILAGVGVSAYLVYKVFLSTEGQTLFDKINNDYIKFLLRLTLTVTSPKIRTI